MNLVLTEANFKETIEKNPKILVFFYRETGCSFCTKMKPIMEKYEETNAVGWYALGDQPDSVTEGLVKNFPTFVAYVDGKQVGVQEGSMPIEQLDLTFTPEKIKAKHVPIAQAKTMDLIVEEANAIDAIAPLKAHLNEVRAELKKRRELVDGV